MKRPNIYTLRRCTIEVAPGGQTAKASRPLVKSGDTVTQEAAERTFRVIAEPGAPSPEIQAQRWAIGEPDWKSAGDVSADEATDLDEDDTDGQ